MKHEMRLDPLPFDEIYSGLKLVESRVNDKKRQKISVGDTIIFYRRPECTNEVKVKVLELHYYKNIKDLVEGTPISYWGPRFSSKKELLDAQWHYTKDEIEQFGMLAIYIKLI